MPATPESVDAYMDGLPPELRDVLSEVRRTVRNAVPEGEERISYRMPAVFKNGVVVYYAAFKRHLGVFPPVSDPEVKARVARYAGPKGNLQFLYSEPIPYDLIGEVVKARLAQNIAAAAKHIAKPPRAARKPQRSSTDTDDPRHATLGKSST